MILKTDEARDIFRIDGTDKEYAVAIEKGEIAVSKRVRAVYMRLAKEADQKSIRGRYIFDKTKANRPIEFIEKFCRPSKGEWLKKPIKLELFQKAFIQAIFGFSNRKTGVRRFREAFFLVGRKNAKSTLFAGLPSEVRPQKHLVALRAITTQRVGELNPQKIKK